MNSSRANASASCSARRIGKERRSSINISSLRDSDLNPGAGFGVLTLRRANLGRRELGLHEQQQIVAAAGLGIRSRHVEAAERMDANKGAGAFAIEIEITDVKFTARVFQPGFVGRIDRARQAELRVIGYPQSVVIVVGLNHGEDGTKDLFLLDVRTMLYISNYSLLA